MIEVGLQRARRVHLVGVGGSGMSAIASVLLDLGHAVSGSDVRDSGVLRGLAERGAQIRVGHDAAAVIGAQVVVVSTAVPDSNPEVCAAREAQIPVIPRAEMLSELMRFKHGVAVAGSHGKTTTTALIAHVLAWAGLEPTAVVGGRVWDWEGASAKTGAGPVIVVEADESDGSFLALRPTWAVWTGAEAEHLEAYGGSFDALQDAFVTFANQIPFYGTVFACVDDPAVRSCLPRIRRRWVGYGEAEDAHVRVRDVVFEGPITTFRVEADGVSTPVRSGLLGRHNVQNLTAAFALAREIGVPFAQVAEAAASFRGVDRRFSIRGEANGVLVADDYGHHPTEIATTLAGVRSAYPGRTIRVGFQPHRFSRTRQLFERFANCFDGARSVCISPVYGAGEPADPEPLTERLAGAVCAHGIPACAVGSTEALVDRLVEASSPGDVVVLFGAGDIHRCSHQVIERLGPSLEFIFSNEMDQ
jgi:UDP-N-acetylmuramate--alanine ligase